MILDARPTGEGKTFSLASALTKADILVKARGLRVLIAVQRHEQAQNEMLRAFDEAEATFSRRPDGRPREFTVAAMPKLHCIAGQEKEIKRVGESGWNPTLICVSCPHFDEKRAQENRQLPCEYIQRKNEAARADVVIIQHAHLRRAVFDGTLGERMTHLVLDENATTDLAPVQRLSASSITRYRALVSPIRQWVSSQVAEEGTIDPLIPAIERVLDTIGDLLGSPDEIVEVACPVDLNLNVLGDSAAFRELQRLLEKGGARYSRATNLGPVVQAAARAWARGEKFKLVGVRGHSGERDLPAERVCVLVRDLPDDPSMLFLDATGTPEEVAALTGRPATTVFEGGSPRSVQITQLLDRTWSRGRFRRVVQDRQAWWTCVREDALAIALAVARARPRSVGLIAYMRVPHPKGKKINFSEYLAKVVKHLSRHLGVPVPEIRCKHWGALKGSNAFVDCDLGILYGTPFVGQDATQARAIVLGASVEDLREHARVETFRYRGRLTKRWTYDSLKMQAAWEALVHAEHVQGLGRFVRGDKFPSKGVLVLSSNPIRTRDPIRVSSLCEECLDFNGARAVGVALDLEASARTEAEVARVAGVGRKVASRALDLVKERGEALRLVLAPQEDSPGCAGTPQHPARAPTSPPLLNGPVLRAVPAPQENSLRLTDTPQHSSAFRPNYLPWRDALEGLRRTHGSLRQVSAALGGSPSTASLSRYSSGKQQPSHETELALCLEYADAADHDRAGDPAGGQDR